MALRGSKLAWPKRKCCVSTFPHDETHTSPKKPAEIPFFYNKKTQLKLYPDTHTHTHKDFTIVLIPFKHFHEN